MSPRILTIILFSLFAAYSYASPAKRGPMILTQPDGTSFTAIFKGDEFIKIKTTAEGHAIMQDQQGWWCYATFDSDGTRICNEWKVGQEVPGIVLNESMNIPLGVMSANAREIRANAAPVAEMQKLTQGTKTKTPSGIKHGIVILAEFQDIGFVSTKEEFESMLMQTGYSRHGATGSAKEYFDDQFGGYIEFDFDVSEIVTLKGKREYYGANNSSGNDSRPADLIIDACRLADEHVDFSLYDDDGDGVVDNVFVFFAGEDEAEGGDENCIWSHAWYIRSGAQKTLQLDGCLIDRYACTSEMTRIYDSSGRLEATRLSGIGTFCHEYSHTFGLPDMYDTDYDNEDGWAAGLWGTTSIMDSGNQNNHGNTPPNFNAIERELLGISAPQALTKDGAYTMKPININGEYFRMETDADNEYYLFECRSSAQKWDSHIGGSGMLIYHIDRKENVLDRWTIHNTVNSDASHQCADLIEADRRRDSFSGPDDYISRKGNTKGLFFPYNDINSISATGQPGLNFWSGNQGKISITGIRINEEGGVDFSVIGESELTTPPSVRNTVDYDVFTDAAIIMFESSREYEGEATVSYGLTGQETATVTVLPYKPGHYSILIEDLQPAKTYTVTMSFTIKGVEGKSREVSFMTKKTPTFTWPYMHFGKAQRNTNGTFLHDSRIPLKIVNAKDASEIKWTFNDKEIKTEGDHYYTLEGSGTLKAHIIWEDGTEEVVVKDITLAPLSAQ